MKISKKSKYISFSLIFTSIILSSFFLFTTCSNKNNQIKLYNTQTNQIETLDIEDYIEGVVAGEISNNSPLEALKAQAVLARTFTLKFLRDNKSKYEGADISTDISEAQAYNKSNINENIKKAVKETKNLFVSYNNDYINAYFFANSGGKTALFNEGFNSSDQKFNYINSVESPENEQNSINYKWTQTFEKNEILESLRNMGVSVSTINTFTKGELGESGRSITFIVGGKEISANTFRLNIGSTKFKSTLIDSITINDESITFKGRGYGHGVGLSQEGSIILANQGKTFDQIINYYFKDVKIISKFN